MRRLVLFVLCVGVLGLAGCGTPSCAEQVAQYKTGIQSLFDEWSDAIKLAGSSPRMQLASQISELQSIRRKVNAFTPVPDCAQNAHDTLVGSMDNTIEAFTLFLGQEDQSLIDQSFKRAQNMLETYTDQISKLAAGQE